MHYYYSPFTTPGSGDKKLSRARASKKKSHLTAIKVVLCRERINSVRLNLRTDDLAGVVCTRLTTTRPWHFCIHNQVPRVTPLNCLIVGLPAPVKSLAFLAFFH